MNLTNAEKEKLDNTCGNLRATKLGTHIKTLEDFVNQNTLETNANTVVEAINELYRMIVNKDCSAVQVPPPGFFTLWGNDEDGKLYCYYNDEDHPPIFRHIEDESADDYGSLYLYIADPEGENHYELKIGEYIAVKHLENYYTKSEINNLLNSKSNTGHKHTQSDISDFPRNVSAFTNDAGYLTTHQNIDHLASVEYVDNQIASIDDDVEIELATYVKKSDVDSSLSSSSTNPVQNKSIKSALDNKVDKVTGKGLSSNDFTDTLKNKLDGVAAGATKNTVSDSLTDSSTINALSANQGKVLKGLVDGKANSSHTHTKSNITDFSHTHGNLSNDGKIGTAANKPVITGSNGVLSAGSFGSTSNTFCQGNDSRLSDSRNPKYRIAINVSGASDYSDNIDLSVARGSGIKLFLVGDNDNLVSSFKLRILLNNSILDKTGSGGSTTQNISSSFPTGTFPMQVWALLDNKVVCSHCFKITVT